VGEETFPQSSGNIPHIWGNLNMQKPEEAFPYEPRKYSQIAKEAFPFSWGIYHKCTSTPLKNITVEIFKHHWGSVPAHLKKQFNTVEEAFQHCSGSIQKQPKEEFLLSWGIILTHHRKYYKTAEEEFQHYCTEVSLPNKLTKYSCIAVEAFQYRTWSNVIQLRNQF